MLSTRSKSDRKMNSVCMLPRSHGLFVRLALFSLAVLVSSQSFSLRAELLDLPCLPRRWRLIELHGGAEHTGRQRCKYLVELFSISFLGSGGCLLHKFFAKRFHTVLFRLEFSNLGQERFMCCDRDWQMGVLLSLAPSTFRFSCAFIESFGEGVIFFPL